MIALLDWDTISPQTLRELNKEFPDSRIAEMYNVSVGKVRYKRKKFGIALKAGIWDNLRSQDSATMQPFNDFARNALLENQNIDALAKAITQYAFRSGVVEDMHSDGKLSDADMKALNIFFSNRVAGILAKAFAGEWLQILLLFDFYKTLSAGWDRVEPDVKEFDMLFERYFKNRDSS
ncbi:MAG: hypothetical protein LBK57_01405 [Clostridiales Family XIII bacterium]|nr:hypothetical protein [Clostridiales Family XIII bacterium]